MKQKNKWMISDGMLGLVALLLIVLLFVTGIFDKGRVIERLQDSMNFEGGKTHYELDAGDAFGRKNDGPFLKLPAGEYRLKWQIEGDGENILHLGTTNGAPIEPAQLKTVPGQWQGEVTFTIKEDAHNFNIYVEFASGTWMKVHDFRLYTPEYRDHTFTAAFVIAAIYILFVLGRRGYFSAARRRDWAVMGIALLFVSSPFMQSGHIGHYDTVFHGARMMNLADALSAGQIPARVGGFSYNGFGAATSMFYPDLFLYPGALMLLGGASLSYVMNVTCIAINLLSAMTMAICASGIFGREYSACAVVLYLCSPYRITNVLSRGAVGEALAMFVLPLFILGLWEVIFGDKRRWPLLGVSAMMMLMTHILSTAICGVMAVGAGILFLPKIFKEKRILPIVKAAVMAVLLSMFYLVPMLDYSRQGIGAQAIQGVCTGLPIFRLFENLEIGVALLMGCAAAIMVCGQEKERKAAVLVCLLAGIGSAVVSTEIFPWRYAAVLTNRLTDYLQFPSRLHIITMSMLSLCGGYGLMYIAKERKQEMLLVTLAIAMLTVQTQIREDGAGTGFGMGEIVTPYSVHMEYQIPGTDVGATRDRSVLVDGDVQMTAYQKNGTQITMEVSAQSDAALTMPLFGFDGYAAELDGERLECTRGNNNRVKVLLPAGAQEELRVWFAGKTSWRIAEAVSAVSALGFIAYTMIRRMKKNA